MGQRVLARRPVCDCARADRRGEVVLGVLGCPTCPSCPVRTVRCSRRSMAAPSCRWVAPIPRSRSRSTTRVRSPTRACASRSRRVTPTIRSRPRSPIGSASPPSPTGSTASASTAQWRAVTRRSTCVCRPAPATQEKIWDHAAGKFVVEQAGGRVTDADGAPLDFSFGARLTANAGVVATSGRFHGEVVEAVRTVRR
ncbi:MAG: inositol monophosphatase family protein [Ilumatobacteraceae bacterium]